MHLVLYVSAVLLIVAILHWRFLVRFVRHRCRLIYYVGQLDGPFSLPLIGTAWMFKWNIEDFARQLFEHAQYYTSRGAGMLRIWVGTSPIVLLVRPEHAKVVLESNSILTKGPEYGILLPWLGSGLLISSGDKWRIRRKMLTPTFHFTILNEFLATHNKEAQILIQQLQPHADTGRSFDIFPFIKRCALDIICETAMGVKVNAQTKHDHPYVRSVQRMNELAFTHERMPWLWLKPLWYALGYGTEYDKHLQSLLQFTRKVIEKRAEEFATKANDGAKKKKAFLDLLLSMQEANKLSFEEIRDEVDTFMFEGHDTTSSGIGWALWCIAHHSKVQEKAIEEVDRIFGNSSRLCTANDLKELKYLERCIKESLRLYPPVPNYTRVAEDDIVIDGKVIPKGCTLLISPAIIHRNQLVYKNAQVYDPDNFLPESVTNRHPFAYIPFSAGPRNCIGQKFAMMEEKTVLSWILRHFRFDSECQFESNIACPEIILKPLYGFSLRLYSRKMEKHLRIA
ncbi:Cytochrome P450 4V2 [Toxocara canis]|uniref:Cytochrome P450 4V2 n=1 Tax=Toxocara canis TaxID=6265 RepID=A0A0B2VYL8_TOXCA|nr:Cytochrome P450 4V2 [Toxocara canis]